MSLQGNRPRVGLQVTVVDPQPGDAMLWDQAESDWVNAPLSGAIDIVHDGSLQGQGNTGSPLGVATQLNVAGTHTNAAYTFDDRGVATGIADGFGTVFTDGVSITGDGSTGGRLTVAKVFTDGVTVLGLGTAGSPLHTPGSAKAGNADWMQTSTTVSGSGTVANIPANSLDGFYNNLIPSQLTASSGTYTWNGTTPALVAVDASVSSTSGGVGNFISSVNIKLTNALATNKIVASQNNQVANAGNSGTPQMSVSAKVVLNNGDSVFATVTNASGASTVTYTAKVSMTLLE